MSNGDWYCKNCGYISTATYSETCTSCHEPVVFHDADEKTALEVKDARIQELEKREEWLLRFVLVRSEAGRFSVSLPMYNPNEQDQAESRENLRLAAITKGDS